MCQQEATEAEGGSDVQCHADTGKADFPWHLGIHDAHCHPTDIMASINNMPSMRARTLTLMATRSQDQHLVASVAKSHGAQDPKDSLVDDANAHRGGGGGGRPCGVVPSFGWHPWFSYQLYDDLVEAPTYSPLNYGERSSIGGNSSEANGETEDRNPQEAAKEAHYHAVLAPLPTNEFIASLPTPTPLSSFLSSTKEYLSKFPLALVGEIGLDKAFRLPQQWDSSEAPSRDDTLTPGGREGRLLSPYRVRMNQQQAILSAQLRLAGEVGRAVSVHGVQAHGVLYDTVSGSWKGQEKKVLSRRERNMVAPGAEDDDEDDSSSEDEYPGALKPRKEAIGGKPFPPRICLHSYTGSVDMLKQWMHPAIPSKIFVSFSTAVNLGTEGGKAKLGDVIRAVPDDRILVESDLHTAGEEMDLRLEDMYRIVCEQKGWDLGAGVERIGRNYHKFVFG